VRLPRASAADAGGGNGPAEMPPGVTTHPVFGGWSATRWQYTSRSEPARLVDVVCDLGGRVTLGLSEGTWVLAWEVAGRAHGSAGGELLLDAEHLVLRTSGGHASEVVRARVSADTLALSAESSAWDFEGAGVDEPAEFVAVLVRL
jgi:hypothetical protein